MSMITANANRVVSETVELGIGFLVAEAEDGAYMPLSPVSTIAEARELASCDLSARMRELETDGEPMCPARYVVWARRQLGAYAIVAEIEA
jgi:hypothetical protein